MAGDSVVSLTKRKLPETNAQKFWLERRNRRQWAPPTIKTENAHGGHPNLPAIGVKHETKQEVINSILNMITPQPDQ